MRKTAVGLLLLTTLLSSCPGWADPPPAPAVAADEDAYQDALKLLDRGKVDAAIYALQQIQEKYPDDSRVLFKLGEIAIAQKNWAYAIEVLKDAADKRPDDVVVRTILMDIYKAYQMPIQEIGVGLEVLNIEPDNHQALERLAFLYHDQAMPDDEEKIRRRLMTVEPNNLDNLNALVELLRKKEEYWEEALVQKRILAIEPNNKAAKRRLAILYGKDGDIFSELNTMRGVLATDPDPQLSHDYHRLAQQYQKNVLNQYQVLEPEAEVSVSLGPIDATDEQDFLTTYEIPLFRQNVDLLFHAQYTLDNYVPTQLVTGREQVDTTKYGVEAIRTWNGTQDRLDLALDTLNVGVSGGLLPDKGTDFAGDLKAFPFLQDQTYGGSLLVGHAEYENMFTPTTGMTAFLRDETMEDIDAYVRLFTRAVGGVSFFHESGDGTREDIYAETGKVSDGNPHTEVGGSFDYYLLGKNALRDNRGYRVGFLHSPPADYLMFDYTVKNINDGEISNLYTSYRGEIQNDWSLIAQKRFAKNWYLYGRQLVGTGLVETFRNEFDAGVRWMEPDRDNFFLIYYGQTNDNLIDQLDNTVEGLTTVKFWRFESQWHF